MFEKKENKTCRGEAKDSGGMPPSALGGYVRLGMFKAIWRCGPDAEMMQTFC